MHQALYLYEILVHIFGHCYADDRQLLWSGSGHWRVTARLARTCRSFKEPALDVLWAELFDLTPLSRCLPEVSCRVDADYPVRTQFKLSFVAQKSTDRSITHLNSQCFSFSRPLEESEWDTLRSYTRRVRSIIGLSNTSGRLDENALTTVCSCPITKPLFPNLRTVEWNDPESFIPLVHHFAASQLTALYLSGSFADIPKLKDTLCALGTLFPHMKRIWIPSTHFPVDLNEIVAGHVRRWTGLQTVLCPNITFDIDVILHLSRMPALTELSFTLGALSPNEFTLSNTLLVFPILDDLSIISESISPISCLLSHILLPEVTHLSTSFLNRPSKPTVKSLLVTIRKTCSLNSILGLTLLQTQFSLHGDPERYQLVLDDLRPCMAFRNLRIIEINLEWSVDLADRDLLELASAWPNLEQLYINREWGWRTAGGITPGGLLQLLQQCLSLQCFCLAIDTRDYITIPQISNFHRRDFNMDIADSAILPEAVPALAAFFGDIAPRRSFFNFVIWNSRTLRDRVESEVPRNLWHDVFRQASARVRNRLGF